jgi:pimeloyl-ACP methyl ester carboxylesterase
MISRRSLTAGAGAALIASVAAPALARPVTTEDMRMPIHEGNFVELNGAPQWVSIRTQDRNNPVLLILQGGPGIPATVFSPIYFDWEQHYTIVQWDQPGGGATHARALAAGGDGALTVERYVADALALTDYLRHRLEKPKIALMGISWGSRLGATMIHRRPELFSHYVGTAQVVSGPRGGRLGYDLALAAARTRGDQAAVAALTRVGPPPYARVEDFFVRQQYTNPPGQPFSPQELVANADVGRLMTATPPDTTYLAQGMVAYDGAAQFLAVQNALFQETWSWDITSLGRRFEVPIYVIQGENDWNTPAALAREWVETIQAPDKAFATIAGGTHNTVPFHNELLAFIKAHVRA